MLFSTNLPKSPKFFGATDIEKFQKISNGTRPFCKDFFKFCVVEELGILLLAKYHFTIKHIEGGDNQVADFLSRYIYSSRTCDIGTQTDKKLYQDSEQVEASTHYISHLSQSGPHEEDETFGIEHLEEFCEGDSSQQVVSNSSNPGSDINLCLCNVQLAKTKKPRSQPFRKLPTIPTLVKGQIMAVEERTRTVELPTSDRIKEAQNSDPVLSTVIS